MPRKTEKRIQALLDNPDFMPEKPEFMRVLAALEIMESSGLSKKLRNRSITSKGQI